MLNNLYLNWFSHLIDLQTFSNIVLFIEVLFVIIILVYIKELYYNTVKRVSNMDNLDHLTVNTNDYSSTFLKNEDKMKVFRSFVKILDGHDKEIAVGFFILNDNTIVSVYHHFESAIAKLLTNGCIIEAKKFIKNSTFTALLSSGNRLKLSLKKINSSIDLICFHSYHSNPFYLTLYKNENEIIEKKSIAVMSEKNLKLNHPPVIVDIEIISKDDHNLTYNIKKYKISENTNGIILNHLGYAIALHITKGIDSSNGIFLSENLLLNWINEID